MSTDSVDGRVVHGFGWVCPVIRRGMGYDCDAVCDDILAIA